jgi:hypothetical protein
VPKVSGLRFLATAELKCLVIIYVKQRHYLIAQLLLPICAAVQHAQLKKTAPLPLVTLEIQHHANLSTIADRQRTLRSQLSDL